MSVRTVIAVVLATAVCCSAVGCAKESDGDDRQSTQSASGRSSEPAVVNTKKCLAKQRSLVLGGRGRLQLITERVLSGSTELTVIPVRQFDRDVRNTLAESSKACGGTATELTALAELIRTARRDGLDEPLLRRVVDAFATWGDAIGQPGKAEVLYVEDPCAAVAEKVRASYDVKSRADSQGTAAWVELVVENRLDHQIYMDHGGRIEATAVRPDGGTRTYSWGGSSSDTAAARAGHTYRAPVYPVARSGPQPRPEIHLFPGGNVTVSEVKGSAYSFFGPCPVEVEPAE